MRSSIRKRLSKMVPTSGSTSAIAVLDSSSAATREVYRLPGKYAKYLDHGHQLLAHDGKRKPLCARMSVHPCDVDVDVGVDQHRRQVVRLLVWDHVVVDTVDQVDPVLHPWQE